jgi:DNA-binding transcriptional LysR family regulator
MRRSVEEGGVDVAFVLDVPVQDVSGLFVEPLLDEGVSVIVPAEHALASSTLAASRDLAGETVLLRKLPSQDAPTGSCLSAN